MGATAFAGAAMPFLGGRDWTFLAGLGVALGAVFLVVLAMFLVCVLAGGLAAAVFLGRAFTVLFPIKI